MSLKVKTLKGFLWMSITSGLSSISKLVVLSILARILSIESFGLIGAALVVISLANLITQMGVGPAIVQKKEVTEIDISMGYTISLILGILSSIVMFFSSTLISTFFKMPEVIPILQVLSVIFLVESISIVSVSRMQRDLEFKKLSMISLFSYIVGYGVISIIFALLDFGVWALVIGQISQTTLRVILYMYYKPFKYRLVYNKKSFYQLMNFGGGFTLAKLGNYLALQGDNMVTARYLGSVSLGVYSRAYSFMTMPISLIGTALDRALFPVMSTIQDNQNKLKKVFYQSTGVISTISVVVSVFICLLAPEIVDVLLGKEKWHEVITPLQILAAGIFFRMSYRVSDSLSKALALVYKRAIVQFIYAFFVLTLTYTLKDYGVAGIAMGVLISLFLNFILMSSLIIYKIDVKWLLFFKENLNGLKIGLALFVPLYISLYFIRDYIEYSILILLLAGFIAFIVVVCCFFVAKGFFFDKILLEFIEGGIKKIKKSKA